MTIKLPKQPNGHQYEEAMAAAVRSIGYFTETQTILDHEGREVLELDLVASPATEAFASKVLLEAKKSSLGFGDVFKIYGWRVFLKIPKGCIVHGVAVDTPTRKAFSEVCPRLDVFAEHFEIGNDLNIATVPILNKSASEKLRDTAQVIGWYQIIAERLCLREFRDLKKKHPAEDIFDRVLKYRRACHLAFFESDPLKRAELLYEAFKNNAYLTCAAVKWQAKQEKKDSQVIWAAVRDSATYPWLQYVMALETKARILIIKNGLEATLDAASVDVTMEGFNLALLPLNFKAGFKRLSASKHRYSIPYILQLYVELFGGFLVDDVDREHLASLAGQPSEAVIEALDILDEFYPTSNGWHIKKGNLSILKMVPAYLRGIGAFFREKQRGLNNYSEISQSNGELIGEWHKAALTILRRELAEDDESTKPIK